MSLSADLIYTPDDLLAMPEGDHFELIDGRLIGRNKGARSSYVATRLMVSIHRFDPEQRMGCTLMSTAGYQCFPGSRVRRTSVSFIRADRMPSLDGNDGHLPIAPDLAAEVISPDETHRESDRKIQDYVEAGTRLFWSINPDVRTVLIYRADGSISGLRESGELDGEDVLPGFRCKVSELFKTPKAP